ncbi:hypothetical protein [Congregibacter sp.]|uniref:hypothetical protein n=1 Tax=Congregibacter sp. TaxID=2744308 RepID=UPI003F6BD6FD
MKKQLVASQRTSLQQWVATLSLCGVMASSIAVSADACEQPSRPELPNGAEASMEAMLAGQKAVKAFQASNMEYMKCLEEQYSAAEMDAKNAKDADAKALASGDYAKSVEAYNAAVSAEEDVAGEFNVALRAYKAANK